MCFSEAKTKQEGAHIRGARGWRFSNADGTATAIRELAKGSIGWLQFGVFTSELKGEGKGRLSGKREVQMEKRRREGERMDHRKGGEQKK